MSSSGPSHSGQEPGIRHEQGGQNTIGADDLPPDIAVMAKKPGRVMCGDIDMRIDTDGKWYYNGTAISRPEMVKLFSTVLYRDNNDGYWLMTPAEMARIKVEDAPFTILEMITEGAGEDMSVRFRTNVGDYVNLDDEHPLRIETNPETGEPRPYVTVRPGLEALITRSVFYQLVEYSVEQVVDGQTMLGVWSNGHFFSLGDV